MKNSPKKNSTILKIKSNEKGVAILLALGFLSLIAILALTFATTTSINRKAAKSNNDLSSARMLAKSVVNRAMMAMATYSGTNMTFLKSSYSNNAGSTTTMVEEEDLFSLLPTTINGLDYYSQSTYTNAAVKPTWQYITIDNGVGTPKIYGRMAFTISNVSNNDGWLMPAAVVDNNDPSVSEYAGSLSNPPTTTSTGVTGRPGINVSEMWLGSLDLTLDDDTVENNTKLANFLTKVSSVNATDGTMPANYWNNSDLFFSNLGITDEEVKNYLLKYFSFGDPEDKEAFWVDNNGNGVKSDDELFHRFNLARTDWNTLTIGDILKVPVQFTTTEDNTGGIPWLNNFKTSSGMGSDTAAKNQIAANIIDYNDSNIAATTDNEDNPTYVGLDESPYINEVKIKFVSIVEYSLLTLYARASIVPEFITIEVVNMYDTDIFAMLYAKVSMDWEFKHGGETYERSDVSYVPIPNVTSKSYMCNNHKFENQGWTYTPWTTSGMLDANITDLKITNLTVKLYDNDGNVFYDYVKLEPYTYPTGTPTYGHGIEGDLDINPGSSSSTHPFYMEVPVSTDFPSGFDINTLRAWPSTKEYNGTATVVKLKPQAPGLGGTSITINGVEGKLDTNTYYTFTGDMNVRVWNTHNKSSKTYGQAEGKWWIEFTGANNNHYVSISPDPGYGGTGIETDRNNNYNIACNNTQHTLYIDYEIADPRQNLSVDDWGGVTMYQKSYDGTDTGTVEYSDDGIPPLAAGSKNTRFTPNSVVNADSEPVAEASGNPWDISTAYIRNAPMQSPVELGAIHRGQAWQTLNLKKYDIGQGTSGGANNYSDGDTNILDQIKMTSDTTTLGKVNLNASEPKVLIPLFEGISTNSGYANPASTGYTVSQSNANALEEALINTSTATTTSQFKTRAEAVNSTAKFYDDTLGLAQTTDATQEEIIGKFINLTKAGNIKTNSLKIIAVVQTIDDVGGGITIKKDLDYNGTIGFANEASLGVDIDGNGVIGDSVSETIINVQFGQYDQYADQITATQKLLIELYKTPTNKYRIRHLEYLNN